MRFSDPSHLARFKTLRRYPEIHDAIFAMVRELADGDGFMDVCCHFGLLGQRIQDAFPQARVCGVEMLDKAVAAGRAAGVSIPLHVMKLHEPTLPKLVELLREHRVTVMVARRCVSEFTVRDHGSTPKRDPAYAALFRAAVIEVGVREFVIQGRAPDPRATWPVPNVEAEAEMLGPEFVVREKRGQCAYLTAR